MRDKIISTTTTINNISCMHAFSVVLLLLFFLLNSNPSAQSPVSPEQLLEEYGKIEEKLLNMSGEVAEINNFVYKKDAATFTFSKGKFLFLRPILNRPTVAIFVGSGNVIIPIPYEVEKQGLLAIAGDTIVEESFDVCYIRFADNLDSLLRSEFTFKKGRLSTKESRLVKNAQGEFFFKPQRWQGLDNYFQLLKSLYNRNSDGFFWAKFNRHIFSFDPSIAEETEIRYEREPMSLATFSAANFPEERRIVDGSSILTDLHDPALCVNRITELKLGGSDGYKIFDAKSVMSVVVNDSDLVFLSAFLDEDLKIDSIFCDQQRAIFHRKKEFNHIGIALSSKYQKGDTIEVAIHYHGQNWGYFYPYINYTSIFPQTLHVSGPKDYNYLFSALTTATSESDTEKSYTVSSDKYLVNDIGFIPLVTGWDTLSVKTSFGLPVQFVIANSAQHSSITNNSPFLNADSRTDFLNTLEYFHKILGYPPIENKLYVQLGGYRGSSYSGLIRLPIRFQSEPEAGGALLDYSTATASQWFSTTAQVVSSRENWILESLPKYLAYMCVESMGGIDAYAYNLSLRSDEVISMVEKDDDLPLAIGVQGYYSKGIWLIHMLRKLMNSVDSTKDTSFNNWVRDVVHDSYQRPLCNNDIQLLAEKHFGHDLSWFFDKWLYGRGVIGYHVSYSTTKEDDGYFLDLNVVTTNVKEEYLAPIILTLETEDNPKFINAFITPKYKKYRYGPFNEEPTKVTFNRYMSVLAESTIKEMK